MNLLKWNPKHSRSEQKSGVLHYYIAMSDCWKVTDKLPLST